MKGFTLIELLVVVLIIGILSAVALPQYTKAVFKSRLAAIDSKVRAYETAIDSYLLANGWGNASKTTWVHFLGPNSEAQLDIELPCDSYATSYCITKEGKWNVFCIIGNSSPKCNIQLTDSPYFTSTFRVAKYAHNPAVWVLDYVPEGDLGKTVCEWWAHSKGKETINSATLTSCRIAGAKL